MIYTKNIKNLAKQKILSELIRRRGLVNVPWPKGLAKELADLLDAAYSESAKKTLAIDDSWMFFIYWRESEFKTGKKDKIFAKKIYQNSARMVCLTWHTKKL